MPSIIPGYEYDIFISYRQKDNKGDRWVTEFVNALKSELDATFKEDISIYFDENPHDGLHDHHDVDDSLRDKLKCLIFLPIVSRTYCDPRSFAWEHEFKAFNHQASNDGHGLRVKLPSGNVTNRVLPIRIHELSADDIKLFEAETRAVMRPIDFVFKSAGVNRPLLPSDKKEENVNHIIYRDQINKVANAIVEIIDCLKNPPQRTSESVEIKRSLPEIGKSYKIKKRAAMISVFILLGAIAFYLFFLKHDELKDPASSGVAILPFRNNTGNEDLNYYGVGMASEIRTKLSMSKQFNFISSLQATLAYGTSDKPPSQIGKELGVDFILSGLYQKAGNKMKVIAELINAENGNVVWSFPYERELVDVFQLQSDIAQQVLNRFSIKPAGSLEGKTTSNLEAYAHYVRGYELYHNSDNEEGIIKGTQPAITKFETAIALDSGFIDAWAGLINAEGFVFMNNVDDTLLENKIKKHYNYFFSHFPTAPQGDLVNGIYQYRVMRNFKAAQNSLQKALNHDPQNLEAILTGSYIAKRSFNFVEAIRLKKQALTLDPGRGDHWRDLGETLEHMGDGKSALLAYLKGWELVRNRDCAYYALIISLNYHLPLENLSPELRAATSRNIDVIFLRRDWKEAKRICREKKDTIKLVCAYFLAGQKDSAHYLAREGLRQGKLRNSYLLMPFLGDRTNAFTGLKKFFQRHIETGDDKLMAYVKIHDEIFFHAIFKEYPEATAKIRELNERFPDFGNYPDIENSPWVDQIKREYPPFQKALNNVKRKPLIDINDFIKL